MHTDLDAALRHRAATDADRPAFTFLDAQERPTTWTFGDLDRRAGRVAAALAPLVAPGDRVLVVLPSGLDFLAAFFGAIRAGAVAVPAWPPDPSRLARTLPRLLSIFDDCAPSVVLTLRAFTEGRELLAELAPRLAARPWLAVEDLPDAPAPPPAPAARVAFLQYTSGSTSAPKGVRVTQQNVRAQLAGFEERHGFGRDTRYVSWLPVQHDLGLISKILPPVWHGSHCAFMSPTTFLRRPAAWLRAVSSLRATMSSGPDFGFALAAARVRAEELVGLDLSSWSMAGVCAEFVRPRTLDAFARAFGPVGFRRAAFHPCYGLAEATLQVSGDYPLRGDRQLRVDPARLRAGEVVPAADGHAVVSCGPPLRGMSVRVVGPDGPLPEGRVGELWIAGDHVADGYWGRPDAFADGAPTGDLGFLHGGDVYVVGRVKDVIILAGTNHHPQDIEEAVAGCHPAIRPDQIAAFGVEVDGAERLGVYVEVDRDDPAVPAAVRRAVAAAFDLPVEGVGLLPPRTLPRTSSGKVQRHACAHAWGTDELPFLRFERLAPAPSPAARALDRLRALAAPLRGLAPESLDVTAPLVALGFDSLLAAELQARVEASLGARLPLAGFIGDASLAALAEALTRASDDAPGDDPGALAPALPAPADAHLPFPQTDMQRAYALGAGDGLPLGGVSYLFYEERALDDPALPALERAWAEVVSAHGMLRAVVLPDGTQRVLDDVPPYPFAVHEVASLEGPAVAATRERLLAARVDPARWPPFAVEVSRAPDGRALLHVAVSLIVCDGASLRRVLHEWAARALGRPVPAPPTLTFRDYQLAAARAEGSARWRRDRAFWLDKLDAIPPAPALPLAAPLASIAPGAARTRRALTLPAADWARLRARAAGAGLTPSQALCAAFADALAAWSAAPDFTLNVTVFNRLPLHPEVDRLVGELASSTLLEVRDGVGDFTARARRLRDQLLANLEHARFSGVRVLGELARRRGLTLMPVVFTSLLGERATADEEAALARALGAPVYTRTQTPQVALDHIVYEADGALHASWDTIDAAFPTGVVDALWGAWRRHLERLAGDAWRSPRRDLLPPAQRAVREAVNATDGPVPEGRAHDPTFEHARRRPDDVAVVTPERALRYGELAARAEGVAVRLPDAPDDVPVAVLLPKGWRQAVALLGVWRAGRVALPLDPDAPAARNRQIVERAGADLVLVAGACPDDLGALPLLDLDALDAATPAGDGRGAGALRPAVVMYTSGSSGEPKGVTLSHRGLRHLVAVSLAHFGIGAGDVFLGLTGVHHDLALFDLLGALSAGARLVLPDPARLRDPAHWLDLMAREGVTVWNSVPTWMEMLLAHAERARVALDPRLRVVILGGDWIPRELPARLRALLPDVALHSIGGPTETTVWNVWHAVGALDPAWPGVPYGRPTPNARYHVLDHRREDRPDLVPGELWCSGVGLALGYHRDPALTEASFLPHPVTGERLYRTGDLGRYHPDGTLEFLGRADHQVKIGGVRVELAECEAALARHPGAAQAVVVASPAGPGRPPSLCAWVVPADARLAADPAQLAFKLARHGLRRFAPDAAAVALPGADAPTAEPARRSTRAFAAEPVALGQLAALLASLRSHSPPALPRRPYPSAGALYPVRVYVHARRVDGLDPGHWYHDPDAHRLVKLSSDGGLDPRWHSPHNQGLAAEAAFSLLLVADLDAIAPLYGDRSRDLCLLEAGYLGQRLVEEAARLGLGLCPIGGVDHAPYRERLALSPAEELVHSFEGGLPRAEGERPRLEDALRAWVAARLPAAMVPARVRLVPALPMSANGKVDRRALAVAAPDVPDAPDGAVSPTEAIVLAAVRAELGGAPLGPATRFFEAGATSVQLVAAAASLSERLGRAVPAAALFEHPSARALGAWLDGTSALADPAAEARERAARRRERRGLGG